MRNLVCTAYRSQGRALPVSLLEVYHASSLNAMRRVALSHVHRSDSIGLQKMRKSTKAKERGAMDSLLSTEQGTSRARSSERAQGRSDVTRLRERIETEDRAAQHGLTGLAQGAVCHRFITARMEQGAERLLKLIAENKHAEVQAI